MPGEFKPIETQEAFDAVIKSRLEQCARVTAEETEKKYAGYISPDDASASKADYEKRISDLSEKLKGNETSISELTAKSKAAEMRAARLKIACETGIPFELSEKLSGETEEEMRKDAEKLAKFTQHVQTVPKYSSEVPASDTKQAAYRAMLQSLNK